MFLGVDKELIQRFSIILRVLNSGYKIDVIKFKEYALTTAKLYVSLYSWYYMPPSVHKVLIHGSAIIESASLPIGQLSEEALEANHKMCKKFRRENTKKHSRVTTNEDLINRLLLQSDPVISLSKTHEIKKREISEDILELLDIPAEEQDYLEEILESDSHVDM